MLLEYLFCSKLMNFISCGPMEALPKLLFVVVVLISTILFSSCCCCLFFVDFPLCENRTYTRILFHWKLIKLPFQRVLIHLNRSPNEGAMAVLFPLLHAVQKISERATLGNSAISACRNLRLTWFLTPWKCNFVGLLNIQRYSVVLPMRLCKTWCEQKLWRCWRAWSCGLRGVTSRILRL
jgi:hypothetical protein